MRIIFFQIRLPLVTNCTPSHNERKETMILIFLKLWMWIPAKLASITSLFPTARLKSRGGERLTLGTQTSSKISGLTYALQQWYDVDRNNIFNFLDEKYIYQKILEAKFISLFVLLSRKFSGLLGQNKASIVIIITSKFMWLYGFKIDFCKTV